MTRNKVKFSLKNVHYAPITIADDGSVTFATPKHIPGACSLTMDAQGSEEKFMADGALYYSAYTDEGYSGTLTLALIPEEFLKDILCNKEDPTDHVLVEYANQQSKPFALLYEINGDQKATRRLLYYCTVNRPGENADGQAPRTPQTEAMSITASPLADGRVRARTLDNTVDGVYKGWFETVWEPNAGV